MSTPDTLGYDVFVADPLPQNASEPLPNGEPHVFQPLAVTLIHGERDAVLVDPPLTEEQAALVGDWVQASGKRLTHILVTHGHGDHWFTADVLARRFGARVVATAATIAQMHGNVAARPLLWDRLWPGQIPPSPVTAVATPDNHLTLEGHEVRLVEVGHTDSDDTSVIHVPDLGLVVAGDVLYNGVHMFIGQSAGGGLDAWRTAIDLVEALEPRWIVASHKDKDRDDDATRVIAESRRYLDDVEDALAKYSTATDFFHAMLERHPERRFGATVLWVGAKSLYNLRELGGDPLQHSAAAWLSA
jgi:glyoxylase-like metal-dependent hydrolase (beta-lactamase superfamily II)